jgi:hypothetical protein
MHDPERFGVFLLAGLFMVFCVAGFPPPAMLPAGSPDDGPGRLQGTLKNSLFGLAGLFTPWRHRKKRRNMSPYAPFFALCQKAKILRDTRI